MALRGRRQWSLIDGLGGPSYDLHKDRPVIRLAAVRAFGGGRPATQPRR